MDGTRSISELLAYLLVAAMAAAPTLHFVAPVFRRWARRARASRVRAAISGALLLALVYMGGSLDKQQHNAPFTPESFIEGGQPSLMSGSLPAFPQWYLDSGYSTADTDSDGIPDVWERWTHTNPVVADANADPDHDGVDNAEEFLHKCDPVKADTDGDGIDDRTEIDGLLAAVPGIDPLSPATYADEEPDTNGDGIPDIWGDPTQYVVFEDLDGDGFCDALEDEYWELGHGAEVVFHVWSSRSCVLETGVGAPIFLPPCTNFTIRACVPTDCDSSARLLGAPDGSSAAGTWKARLSAEWPPAPSVDIERDRIRAANGSIIDITPTRAVFAGLLGGVEPQRSSSGLRFDAPPPSVRNSTVIWFRRKTMELTVSRFCREHGPGPVVTATLTGFSPPLLWEIVNTSVSEVGDLTFSPQSASWDGGVCEVRCSKLDGHSDVVLSATIAFSGSQCETGGTNMVGAGWTSTHNPEDASDHAPYVEENVLTQFGPLCPVSTNTVVHVGWTHNTAILWIRNLIRKLTGHPEDDDTDHCINVLWSDGGSLDLWSFLDPVCIPYTNALSIREWKNGGIDGAPLGTFIFGEEPEYVIPDVHNIVLCDSLGTIVYDRMWLVVSSPDDQISFDDWYDQFSTNLTWTFSLPRPPPNLLITTNSSGKVSAATPSPYTSQWSSPHEFGSLDYMHHNAKYDLRTEISGQHGNQATYDEFGKIITHSIAAGSADWFGPYGPLGTPDDARSHRKFDVHPYLRALQLDGNPGLPSPRRWRPTTLVHPCLRQGEQLDRYLFCRPCIY